MSRDKDFHDYVLLDVMKDISGITSKAMFGGYGFYRYGKVFAIIADGKLYFKVGDSNRSDYEDYGSQPFVTEMKGKKMSMSYYELPEDIMENREELEIWIEKSLAQHKK